MPALEGAITVDRRGEPALRQLTGLENSDLGQLPVGVRAGRRAPLADPSAAVGFHLVPPGVPGGDDAVLHHGEAGRGRIQRPEPEAVHGAVARAPLHEGVGAGMLLQLGQPKRGADDACGGCPKDFRCDLASLQCVPEDAHW